jgi:hypothetical protein
MPRSQRLTRQKPSSEVKRMNQPRTSQSTEMSEIESSPPVIRKNDSHSAVASATKEVCSSEIPAFPWIMLLL